jgi:hypothetical protein
MNNDTRTIDNAGVTASRLLAYYLVSIPDGGISSGRLYADAMALGVTLETHNLIISRMSSGKLSKRANPLINVRNHYITLTNEGARLRAAIAIALASTK